MSDTFEKLPPKAQAMCARMVRHGVMTESRYLELFNGNGQPTEDEKKAAMIMVVGPQFKEFIGHAG